MKLRTFTLSIFLTLFSLSLFSQDLHFTQFYLAPLHTNPSQTGAFLGSYRLSGIYRSQYDFGGATLKGYSTPNLSLDIPLNFGLRKQDWVGVGVNVVQDKSGRGELQQGGIMFSAAYHFSLDKKQTQVLTLGGYYGLMSRKINPSLLSFEDGIRLGTPTVSADNNNVQSTAKSYTDIGAGISFRSKLNKTSDINIGFAIHHINKPNYNLISSSTSSLPSKISLSGVFNTKLTNQFSLSPGFIFQTIAGQSEIGIQGIVGYKLDPKKDLTLNAGLGYRLGDALQYFLGATIGDIRVGGAFDMTTSDLRTGNPKNGLEIGVTYIGKIFKKPSIDPAILCPRY